MRTYLTLVFASALSLALAACGDDGEGQAPTGPDAGLGPSADASLPAPDGGVSSAPIPLIDWVDDLVDHHTDESSPPDTVHDKNIMDTDDPNKFEKRFADRP